MFYFWKQKQNLKVTILGSGTSQGIPVIACDCSVCTSENVRDKRLRSSVMLSFGDHNYVIDSGPDFRQQMLREHVLRLDALIFTHEHKDHLAGMDDVRAFNFKQKKDMPVYCTEEVEQALKREFEYVFAAHKYPGIPQVELRRIDKSRSFILSNGKTLTPIEVMHYRMPVLGFRCGDFTYITDAKTITPEELEKVRGTKVLILNALRKEEHISHLNLDEALAWIREIKPEKAYLTHISHLLGKHEDVEKELPPGVYLCYDGMTIDMEE